MLFRFAVFVSLAADLQSTLRSLTAPGMGVRRTVLHQLIAKRAAGLGIDFLWHAPVTGISGNEVTWETATRSARVGLLEPMEVTRASGAGPAWMPTEEKIAATPFGSTIALRRGLTAWNSIGAGKDKFTLRRSRTIKCVSR